MSVVDRRPVCIQSSNLKRRKWQLGSRKQNSFSLDIPQSLYNNGNFLVGLENCLFEEPLKTRDEDRFFLYLPRNLSYCEVCSDVIKDHVQKKVRFLSSRLTQLEDLPPTPVDTRSSTPGFGFSDDDDDGGLWTVDYRSVPQLANRIDSQDDKLHPILKRKKRAVSFPAPRREGKKIVRFADALGLELESIRYLVQKDLPTVVASAVISENKVGPDRGSKKIQLMPAFLAPSLSKHFMQRLRKLNVSLHSVSTADSTVYGIISVINLTFHKTVFVRYSANAWLSYHDEHATYLEGSSDDDSDKFSFTLFCNPSDLSTRGHSLFFAVCYHTADNRIFWDSNDDKNYCIKCEIKDIPAVGSHSWVHFL